ncbi:MAG TPA: patatin-like phospholipase family protein [Xanthobacteraceae bacterium]|nr:patatin-like phospholipase family protein [Xanthobacteraceae bacterium]
MNGFLRLMNYAGLAALLVAAYPIASLGLSGTGVAQAQPRHPAHARPAPKAAKPPAGAPAAQASKFPPRTPFTAAEDAAATIPGMPDARFWADSKADFDRALPKAPGPWLILSTGGEDGAFGAGFLNGLSAGGQRPDYSVVTGVSTGALMAPFAFAGAKYDAALKQVYTTITAADVFEVGSTGESFIDSWPLKDLIAKQITPELLADIAAAYKAGRRLFVVTTDLDAERSVVWNMGAIAVHAGDTADKATAEAAVKLFRNVLLASGSVPGAFPPVLIDVAAGGKHFSEMHVDGGVGGQFFVTPSALLAPDSGYHIPATQLYIVINSALEPDFAVVDRSTPAILAQTVGMAVKVDLRLMLDRTYRAAKSSGIGFNVASIAPSFSAPSRGPFDPQYMKALFDAGYDQGKGATPFATAPPPYPGPPGETVNDAAKPQPGDVEKEGATK